MPISNWRVQCHVPQVAGLITITVQAGNWAVAVSRAAKRLRREPAVKRRRIQSLSLVVTKAGGAAMDEPASQPSLPMSDGG